LKNWPSDDDVSPSPQIFVKGLRVDRIDQTGKAGLIGFVADGRCSTGRGTKVQTFLHGHFFGRLS
jgi:hypothetical protein